MLIGTRVIHHLIIVHHYVIPAEAGSGSGPALGRAGQARAGLRPGAGAGIQAVSGCPRLTTCRGRLIKACAGPRIKSGAGFDPVSGMTIIGLFTRPSNLNLDLLNWGITILSAAITSYFYGSSNWSAMDSSILRHTKCPGRKQIGFKGA